MSNTKPPLVFVLAAFASVYFIWGSTYLGIRLAIETIPPFTMAAIRFLSAGTVLYGWALLRGAERPAWVHWRTALIVGWLLLGGNGLLSWAEQFVPSGIAALIVATVPMWMVVIDAVRPGGHRPSVMIIVGLVIGLIGIAILVGPSQFGDEPVDLLGALVIGIAALLWALGSVYSKDAPSTPSTIQNVGMQMLLGGALLLGVGLALGERIELAAVSARSAWALVYLASAGGIVAYAAYLWLLKVSTPAKVSTYAYVNPVVAVILGWAVAGEALNPRVFLAGLAVVSAVALITTTQALPKQTLRDEPQADKPHPVEAPHHDGNRTPRSKPDSLESASERVAQDSA